LVKLRGSREGDIKLEDAQEQIGWQMLLREESARSARQAAEGFLKRVKAGETLADIFTADDDVSLDDDADKKADEEKKEEKSDGKSAPTSRSAVARSPLKHKATAPFARSGQHLVPGVGISKELTEDAFAAKKKGDVLRRLYDVGNATFLATIKSMSQPDMGDWTKRKEELVDELHRRKSSRRVMQAAQALCQEANKKKEIRIRDEVVSPPFKDSQGKPKAYKYKACDSLKTYF
jgi:hypothetical protein